MSKRLFPIVGGQFGSEAKGHVAAQLARREIDNDQKVWAVRVAGHNAGHTSYDSKGQSFALRSIPCMAVVDPEVQLFIAAGSEVNLEVLESEIAMLEAGGHPVRHRLYLDPELTLIEDRHFEQEGGMHEGIGSTGKGVGAARAERAMRKALRLADTKGRFNYNVFSSEDSFQYKKVPYNTSIILEGTQGFGLGLHAGFYPYCTSSNTRAIDFLAMACIDPVIWALAGVYEPIVVFRTFPIRVAGNSGPLHDETTWEQLTTASGGYIQPERTTVTKKVRRVGGWDRELMIRALAANGELASAAITFADYMDPGLSGETDLNTVLSNESFAPILDEVAEFADVRMVTTGPDTAVML